MWRAGRAPARAAGRWAADRSGDGLTDRTVGWLAAGGLATVRTAYCSCRTTRLERNTDIPSILSRNKYKRSDELVVGDQTVHAEGIIIDQQNKKTIYALLLHFSYTPESQGLVTRMSHFTSRPIEQTRRCYHRVVLQCHKKPQRPRTVYRSESPKRFIGV